MATLDTAGLNQAFTLLTNPRRRFVLYYLTRETTEVTLETLAAEIARSDCQTGPGQDPDLEHIEASLQHTHLPKLATEGVIRFDAETGEVELRELNGTGQFLDETAEIDGFVPKSVSD